MNEFTAWIASNWYALGNLLSQIAFLVAGVWFASKILKTMRASQEQVGALLRLSVTGTLAERPSATAVAERSFASESPYWLTPPEIPPASPLELPETRSSRLAVAGHGLMVWLQTPMRSGGPAPWRKAVKWLQAPVRS